MATNMEPTGDTQRIAVNCNCGKRLSTSSRNAGKLLKCPACGEALAVPRITRSVPLPAPRHDDGRNPPDIIFDCICGKRLKIQDEHAGNPAQCPFCGEAVVVPVLLTAQRSPIIVTEPVSESDADQTKIPEQPQPSAADRQSLAAIVGGSVVVLLVVIAIRLLNGSDDLPPDSNGNSFDAGSQEPSTAFRKELFEKAHRAAVEFSPGGQIKLATELELIESAVRGEDEENVFKILKVAADAQTDLNVLEVGLAATANATDRWDALTASEKNIAKQFRTDQYDEFVAISTIYLSGGVVVSSRLIPDLETVMKPLLDRQSLTPEVHNGVHWIDYATTKSRLRRVEKAILQTAAEMINNNGKPRM